MLFLIFKLKDYFSLDVSNMIIMYLRGSVEAFANSLSLSAESEGFEPPVQSPVHRISSAAHSTTLATFQSGAKIQNS